MVAVRFTAAAQQELKGQAFDQHNQAPLSYATVVLKAGNAEGRVVQSTLADETGHFSLKIGAPGGYQLSVLMVGFVTYTQQLQLVVGKPALDLGPLGLQTAVQKLDEVVVTGHQPLIEQKLDRVTMNVGASVLAIGNDAYNILAMAPAVQLIDGRITLRGKSNVLILLDGKRLPRNTNLETLLASIPGDQIDRIDLISNPSAKYDADASGGVIEIYTKRSKGLGWAANVGANASQGYRSAGGINGGVRASTAKLDITASGSYTHRGNVERGYQNRTLYQGAVPVGSFAQAINWDRETIENSNFDGSLNYHLNPRNTIGVDAQLLHASLTGGGLVSTTIAEAPGTTFSNSLNNTSLRADLASYNVFYRRSLDTLNSSLTLASNFARYVVGQQQTFDQSLLSPGQPAGVRNQFRNTAPATYSLYTSEADYVKKWSAALSLETGIKYTHTVNSSSQVTETLTNDGWAAQPLGVLGQLGYQEHIAAGYLNLNHTAGKLSTQVGLRAERTQYRVISGIDSSYFNLFPNVRADYKVSDQYSTSLAYAKNINRPSYSSLIPFELFLDNYNSSRGNAYLQPEYTHGFSWNQLYKGYGLQLGYTRTSGAISSLFLYDPAHQRLIMTERNFRERHLSSATLTVPLTPAKWWNSSNTVGVLYQELSYPDPFTDGLVRTKYKTYYTASSDNTFLLGKNWTLQMYGVYDSPTFNGLLDYGSYSYVSLGAKRAFWNKKAALKLDVADLFYQGGQRRTSADVIPVVSDGLLRNDTRRVRLSFTYKFGKTDLAGKRTQTKGNAAELNRLGM
ncbi:hypothetical protein BEN49_07405 [Hymenobacter coccineus]|uniref:Outer membrane protein beta-barrel domain-containing protein n=1 Tax=Hymenobacter coccineus TaxID=1908235 RepID=A0A1G1TH14_9BACT|nr:hypothetical protein BEN49_07405 [Hymenobacter coccineus]